MEIDLAGDNITAGSSKVVSGAAAEPQHTKLASMLQIAKGYGPYASMSLPDKARLRRALRFGDTLLGSAWTTSSTEQLLGRDGAGWSSDDVACFTSGMCGELKAGGWGFSSWPRVWPSK